MNRKKIILLVIALIAVIAFSFTVNQKIQNISDRQIAIINALATAGVLEQNEEGQILVNPVVRFKDIPQ